MADIITLLHAERPKLYAILAFLSAIGIIQTSNLLFDTHGFFKAFNNVFVLMADLYCTARDCCLIRQNLQCAL